MLAKWTMPDGSAVSTGGREEGATAYGRRIRGAIRRALEPLGAHDPVTWEHSFATGEWARLLARQLGLSQTSCAFASRCGQLHDIGKLFVPLSILQKPGS